MKIGDRVEHVHYDRQATVERVFDGNPSVVGVRWDHETGEYMQHVLGYSIVAASYLRLVDRATEGEAMNAAQYEKIGTLGVDSGAVMVVDPAYVINHQAEQITVNERLQSMVEQLQAGGQMDLAGMGLHGDGVAAYTGIGDGVFSVYRVLVAGKVVGLFVDLAGVLDAG